MNGPVGKISQVYVPCLLTSPKISCLCTTMTKFPTSLATTPYQNSKLFASKWLLFAIWLGLRERSSKPRIKDTSLENLKKNVVLTTLLIKLPLLLLRSTDPKGL